MVTNENTPDSTPAKSAEQIEAENKNGQMLVIYLPEGSVIVDRTDVDLTKAPHKIVERTITAPSPEANVEEPPKASTIPMQPTLQEVVQLAVQEVMQTNGKSSNTSALTEGDEFARPTPRRTHSIHLRRRRRRINWVHVLNLSLISYIVLVSILPAVLSSFFGVAIYASKVSHPGASIAAGDLMICQEMRASDVKVNDVVLVRDGNTWRLDARQVTSKTSGATESTINTASTSAVANSKTYVMSNTSQVYKVSTIVPKLGIVPMILASTVVKVLGALFALILNLSVHYRRARRRRPELVIR